MVRATFTTATTAFSSSRRWTTNGSLMSAAAPTREVLFEPSVDLLRREALRRGGRAGGQPLAQRAVGQELPDRRRRQRPRLAGRDKAGRSPCVTISGTPPTDVAIAGVPTARASTSMREVLPRRGKECSVRRAGGRARAPRQREEAAEEASAAVEDQLACMRLQRAARWSPSPASSKSTSGTWARTSSATPAPSAPSCGPRIPAAAGLPRGRAGEAPAAAASVGKDGDPLRGYAHPRTMAARNALGQRTCAACRSPSRSAGPHPEPTPPLVWNSTGSRSNWPRLSARSNAGSCVAGDEGLYPRERAAGRRPAQHPGRVETTSFRAASVPNTPTPRPGATSNRFPPRDPVHGVSLPAQARRRPSSRPPPRARGRAGTRPPGRVASRAADVGRPDPGDDQDPHAPPTSGSAAPGRSLQAARRWIRFQQHDPDRAEHQRRDEHRRAGAGRLPDRAEDSAGSGRPTRSRA